MNRKLQVGLVGDRDESVIAHRAIPRSLDLAAQELQTDVRARWLPTQSISSDDVLNGMDGVWCVPASPYRSMDGALRAIRVARERLIPFLGTCGGFQHAIIEFARHRLGWSNADHAETVQGDSEHMLISPLACSLVEVSANVRFAAGSKIENAYGAPAASEGYQCRFGLNPRFAERLLVAGLEATAWDENGEVCAVELAGHPFFVATLFQPERAALRGILPKLPLAFVRSAVAHARLSELSHEKDLVRGVGNSTFTE